MVGLLGAVIFVFAAVYGTFGLEGYSQWSQFISESYATGMPNAVFLQYAYVISGVFLALFGFLASMALAKSKPLKTAFVMFAIFYGLGTMITGYFPCDIGCVTAEGNPSISQIVHQLTGTLTYMIVPFCIASIGFLFQKEKDHQKLAMFSLVAGGIAFSFVVLLFADGDGSLKGLYQRIIEVSILSWVCFVSFHNLKST